MRKILFAMLGLAILGGCVHYDYYRGDVRYTQDGDDCIYRADERGHYYTNRISNMKSAEKIVYENTRCVDLYDRDMGRAPNADRMIAESPEYISPCGATRATCNSCGSCVNTSKRMYVIVK